MIIISEKGKSWLHRKQDFISKIIYIFPVRDNGKLKIDAHEFNYSWVSHNGIDILNQSQKEEFWKLLLKNN